MLHHRKKKKEAKQEGIELLRSIGIPSPDIVFKYYPHQLSGGMRQRVMIAMASACKPSLLIADEATTELDVTTQLQILESLKNSVETRGYSLLLITHNLGVIANMCKRVYVMYAGKIMEVANMFDLFENPKHPYTIGLLESTFSTEESKEELVSIKGSVPDLMNLPAGCRFHPRCPRIMDKCRERNPEPIQIGSKHWASCLLYD
jgi:oligopeptide/dipeptide ABC transporter ATP-binding protein